MATKIPAAPQKRLRADAQRNRERILAVAKQEFTDLGAHASLEEIAKKAAVGPGTLYRHFPTREALLVAVYRCEMERLAAAQQELARTLSPVEALRAWLLLFVDAVETKQVIAPVLNALVGEPKKVLEASHIAIHEAIRKLVKRASDSGAIRKDFDPLDLLRALVGVAHVAASPDWPQSARRLVDILIAGARPVR